MKKNQTAVEWLYENLQLDPFTNKDLDFNEEILKQALEMEKEKLIDFFIEGCNDPYYYQANKMNAETYFDKNFKKN